MNKSRSRILLLGSTGMLGSSLTPFLSGRGYEVLTQGRRGDAQYKVDLCKLEEVNNLLDLVKPETIINLVGLTDVENCEIDPNKAYLANTHSVENIIKGIQGMKTQPHLVHISTDQVYDGLGLHIEHNAVLRNYYAFSKYAGELAALSISSTILRTNFFGRSRCEKRKSLTDWLFESLSAGKAIQVFDDVLFSPLSIMTLANLIDRIICIKPLGVFNLGSLQGMSKSEFAFTFANEIGVPTTSMTRTTTDKVAFLKTYRPKNMQMDCSKIESALGVAMPILMSEIKQVAKEYL